MCLLARMLIVNQDQAIIQNIKKYKNPLCYEWQCCMVLRVV